jgi:hypothetical protein
MSANNVLLNQMSRSSGALYSNPSASNTSFSVCTAIGAPVRSSVIRGTKAFSDNEKPFLRAHSRIDLDQCECTRSMVVACASHTQVTTKCV